MAITINVNLDEILQALKDDLDFTGNADKYIKVNATADGFEFAAVSTSVSWGEILGLLSDQTDLQNAFDLKANLSGAAFTGDVSVTTSGSGTTLGLTNSGSGTTLNIANSGSGDFLVIDTNKLVVSNNGNLAVDTNTLFVDATNNRVGVGTSSPSNNFDIKGGNTQLRIGVQDTAGLFLMSNLPSGAFMAGGAEFIGAWRARTTSAGLIGTYNGDFRIYLNTSLTANQNYTPTERFTVLSTGNVGINDTSPSAMLEIVSNGVSKVGQIIQAAAGQTANLLEINSSSGSGGDLFRVEDDGTVVVMTRASILQSGNISRYANTNGGSYLGGTWGTGYYAGYGVNRGTYTGTFIEGADVSGSSFDGINFSINNETLMHLSKTTGLKIDNDTIITSPTTSTIPLTVQAAAGQTANLLEVKNSGGTNLFEITASGGIATNGNAGFTGTGSYTNFTIENGIITAAS